MIQGNGSWIIFIEQGSSADSEQYGGISALRFLWLMKPEFASIERKANGILP